MINDTRHKLAQNIQSKIESIKKRLVKLILNSTSHGLPCVFRTEKTLLKIIWLLAFILSTSFGSYFCIKSILFYLEKSSVTQIDVIHEVPIQFPTVTFKNLEISRNYSLNEILINCYFDDEDCSINDFEINDNVFKFNSGKNQNGDSIPLRYTKQAGKQTGLQLELFAGFLNNNTKSQERYYRTNGFHITVHNYTINPKDYDGLDISTGFSTNLIINKIVTNNLEKPYNECFKNLSSIESHDSKLFKFIINSTGYAYRQKDCYDLCLSQYLINQCNSSIQIDYSDKIYDLYQYDASLIYCFDKAWTQFFKCNVNEICSQYCPLECDSINFDTATSFSKFPNLDYANDLFRNSLIVSKFPCGYNITYEDLQSSLIAFNVFYDDLKYTIISQAAQMSVLDLMSNIGGVFGLFIGISLLSLVEIFEIFIEIIFIIFEKEK